MIQINPSIPGRHEHATESGNVWIRPAIPLLLSFIAGILSGEKLPGHSSLFFIPAILSISVVAFQMLRKKSVLFSPLVLFLCLGYLSIQSWTAPRFPENHIIHYTDGQKRTIQGTIVSEPFYKNHRQRFIFQAEDFIRGNHTQPVTGKLRMTVAGELPDISQGDSISFPARIRSIRNFGNPGGFDYRRFMAFKGIRATAYTRGEKINVIAKKDVNKTVFPIERFRKNIEDVIDETVSGPQRHILKALILGSRYSMPDNLREAFNRTGTGHLLAISGLHIGIIATFSFFFFSWILSRFKIFLWHALVKKGAAILSIFPVLFYGFLSGMSPSTQRAVIMVSMFLVSFLFEREPDIVNTISIAAFCILLFFPPALFSVSFQLSFSAVLSIVFGLSKLRPVILDKKNRIPRSVQKMLLFTAVSFFATAGTMPVVMSFFNQISLIGILINLIAVPIIGFMVVPIGLSAVFIWPANHFISVLCFNICGTLLSAAVNMIHFASGLPFAAVKTVTPNIFEIICFYLLLWGIINLDLYKGYRRGRNGNPAAGTAKIISLAACVFLIIDAGYWSYHRFFNKNLRVTMLDTGQGSAALLELPKGYCMLIDGGGFSSNAVFDVGERIVAPFLWGKKIRTVETIVLSHPNSDHMNGLIYIAKHFNVNSIWSSRETSANKSYAEFIRTVREKGIAYPLYSAIKRRQKINGVDFQILYPKKDFLPAVGRSGNINNNSLVIRAAYKSVSFLFPGDIMEGGEGKLTAEFGDRLNTTILLAPHHGSRTSNTEDFLKAVSPETVVVSAGWKNRFGLPHSDVLSRYQSLGARIYQTGLHGAISFKTDGHSTQVSTGR